jgi:hypothetical protein
MAQRTALQYAANLACKPSPVICRTNNAATNSLSNLYARRCIFHAVECQLETIRRGAMTEKAYRFGASAIDELNKHRGGQRLSSRQFSLLMAGLVALLLLLYLQIVW